MTLIKININSTKIGHTNYRLLNHCDKMINLKYFSLLFLKHQFHCIGIEISSRSLSEALSTFHITILRTKKRELLNFHVGCFERKLHFNDMF